MPHPKDDDLYEICTNNINLGDLGPGFPLFFEFMRYLVIYLLILTMLYFVPVALNILRALNELNLEDIELNESSITLFSYGAFVRRNGTES
jgi:hypothetical protein